MFRAYCSSFVTGYLPAVTTPCPSAPTPPARRIVVCSGNDIPMITELGEPANDGFTSPNQTQTHIGLHIIIGPLLVLRERFNCLWVFHVTLLHIKKQKIMRCLEFIIFSVMELERFECGCETLGTILGYACPAAFSFGEFDSYNTFLFCVIVIIW